ncbi:MAG: glycosyltransferase family 4 protein [Candidatus Schekmanbacteria bacterium]|nr:glycosyltransferase family 4 protein [Candidatus Schekmanbacteria bacterium]
MFQLVPALHRGDAIGDEVIVLHRTFASWGMRAGIVCPSPDAGLEEAVVDPAALTADGDTVLVLHFALPSALTALFGTSAAAARVLIHHNLTPPRFFAGDSEELFAISRLGREHLLSIAGATHLGLADSSFNEQQLRELGYTRTGVLPIMLDAAKYRQVPNPVLLAGLRGGARNAAPPPRVLFVGRIAPNKRIEDVIAAFSSYQRHLQPAAHLDLAGKVASAPYYQTLLQLVRRLGVRNVRFYGHVTDAELLALFTAARAFVCLSAHEGFCVPLIEAMTMGVPVIAKAAAAVPETLGDGGVLLSSPSAAEVAHALHAAVEPGPVREKLIAAGRRRAAAMSPTRHLPRLQEQILSLLEPR